jgi:hypothetical protein
MRNLVLASLLLVPLASSCVLAAAGAAGVVASGNLTDSNVYVTQVNCDSRSAWNITKKFLAEQSKELIEWDDQTRVAKANIDDSVVTVKIETWDVDQCQMTVSAKKFLATMNDGEMAKIISERLVRRMRQ